MDFFQLSVFVFCRPPSAGSNITMKGKSAVANGSVGVHPSISSHNTVSARKQKEATLVSDPSEEVLGIGAHVIDHEDVSDDVGGEHAHSRTHALACTHTHTDTHTHTHTNTHAHPHTHTCFISTSPRLSLSP